MKCGPCPTCEDGELTFDAGYETGGEPDERWWVEWYHCPNCGDRAANEIDGELCRNKK
jgi:hypothetical protein